MFEKSGVKRLLLLLAWAALSAGAAPSFRGESNDKTGLGVAFPVLYGATPEPLPPVQVHAYTFTRGAEVSKLDLYDPRELWRATQWKGQWRDKSGNRLAVARATHALPAIASPVREGRVSREAFDAAAAQSALDPADPAALAKWAADFTGRALGEPEKIRAAFTHVGEALYFPAPGAVDTLVWLFRAKGAQRADWCAAVVTVADGTPVAKVREAFEKDFLGNVRPARGAAQAPAQPAAIRPAANSATIPPHPSRDAAKRSITGLKNWWFAETPGHIILSDLQGAEGRRLVKDLESELPVLLREFRRLVPPLTDDMDVGVVRIYANEKDYKEYVDDSAKWSAGLWSPARRELLIQGNHKREAILGIIRHEGFHQYLFHAADRVPNAVWFNEGHACFFETAKITRGKVEIPEDKSRARILETQPGAVSANIPVLLSLSHDAFYSAASRDLNYATAWALVYYLRKGAPSQKNTAYAGVLPAYLKKLAETKDAAAATRDAFEDVDMARLQRDFLAFWGNPRARATAAGHTPP